MPSAYLQWRFHSGERVVARGPLVFRFTEDFLKKLLPGGRNKNKSMKKLGSIKRFSNKNIDTCENAIFQHQI